jgi:hypothetical protein
MEKDFGEELAIVVPFLLLAGALLYFKGKDWFHILKILLKGPSSLMRKPTRRAPPRDDNS